VDVQFFGEVLGAGGADALEVGYVVLEVDGLSG